MYKQDLEHQLTRARQEINNLRKQLNALKQVHRKDIERINLTLNEWRCPKCKETSHEAPAPLAEETFKFKPIGTIHSEFPHIRGTPRQPSITMNDASALLVLDKDTFTNPNHSLEGLQEFSHLWIIFGFHKNSGHSKAKVAPPRLNGARMGVFATRSPHRPCPIGLSLVRIEKIRDNVVHFSGVDMIDQTPVFDVKPYIPRYDQPELGEVRVPPWISEAPVCQLAVRFAEEALEQLEKLGPQAQRSKVISKILAEDPRSVYLRDKWGDTLYTLKIANFYVECKFNDLEHSVEVIRVISEG